MTVYQRLPTARPVVVGDRRKAVRRRARQGKVRLMTRPYALRTALCLPSALLLATALVACGGDDEDSGKDRPSLVESSDPGLAVTDGTTPDDLLTCLTDASLPAVAKDSVPLGVDVPVAGIEVTSLEGWDGTQGADLWVFADPATAEEYRSYITLSDVDTETSRVAGNVVVRYFYVPTEDDQQLAALDACLPA
jgi:hypothetical protein